MIEWFCGWCLYLLFLFKYFFVFAPKEANEAIFTSKVVTVYLVVLKIMVELQVLMMELMVGHKLKN